MPIHVGIAGGRTFARTKRARTLEPRNRNLSCWPVHHLVHLCGELTRAHAWHIQNRAESFEASSRMRTLPQGPGECIYLCKSARCLATGRTLLGEFCVRWSTHARSCVVQEFIVVANTRHSLFTIFIIIHMCNVCTHARVFELLCVLCVVCFLCRCVSRCVCVSLCVNLRT